MEECWDRIWIGMYKPTGKPLTRATYNSHDGRQYAQVVRQGRQQAAHSEHNSVENTGNNSGGDNIRRSDTRVNIKKAAFEFRTTEEKPKWLEKSYLGVLSYNMDCDNIKEKLFLDGFYTIRVTPMGGRTVLLRADEEGELEDLLSEERDWFEQRFDLSRKSEPSDVATDRFTWLEFGRVLIATTSRASIDTSIRVKINNDVYDVRLVEERGELWPHNSLSTNSDPEMTSSSSDSAPSWVEEINIAGEDWVGEKGNRDHGVSEEANEEHEVSEGANGEHGVSEEANGAHEVGEEDSGENSMQPTLDSPTLGRHSSLKPNLGIEDNGAALMIRISEKENFGHVQNTGNYKKNESFCINSQYGKSPHSTNCVQVVAHSSIYDDNSMEKIEEEGPSPTIKSHGKITIASSKPNSPQTKESNVGTFNVEHIMDSIELMESVLHSNSKEILPCDPTLSIANDIALEEFVEANEMQHNIQSFDHNLGLSSHSKAQDANTYPSTHYDHVEASGKELEIWIDLSDDLSRAEISQKTTEEEDLPCWQY
ncbi:unnamed protein product [Lupinus luteus]|uniref:Uncharacterized protein n=1 Tax=Lupinus luteus TaxID=3873 RepID=A0AAV1XHA4_LUPLU